MVDYGCGLDNDDDFAGSPDSLHEYLEKIPELALLFKLPIESPMVFSRPWDFLLLCLTPLTMFILIMVIYFPIAYR